MNLKDASTCHPEWVTQGAKFATIDYNDQSTLVAAFEGVEVAISTVKNVEDGIRGQKALADAAKTAGVKIFAPSEYGSPFVKIEGGIAFKEQIHDHLRQIGLPYVLFYTGPWADAIFHP